MEEVNTKKKLSVVLAVTLALTLLLTGVAFADGGKNEVVLAQEAGQAWLYSTVEITGEPREWIGAHLTTPQVCYDLKGKPNAYMFAMENDGEVVGYVIVGSSDYGYPVFEAADVPPPSIPSADKGKSILERDLGLKVEKIGKPSRLLYLGFDNLYAVYQAGQQDVAVNLKFDSAIPAANLKAAMPSPEEYKANKKATGEAVSELLGGGDYNLLSLPPSGDESLEMEYYCGCGPCYPECKCCMCGPSSGVSIGRYYRDIRGYDDLPGDDDMYDDLYDYMGAYEGDGAIEHEDYGPGFVEMTEECGYDNFSYFEDSYPSAADYENIVNAIDNGWPVALCGNRFQDELVGPEEGEHEEWPPSGKHIVVIKGYLYPFEPSGEYSIICTDSHCKANWLYLDWNRVTYFWVPYTCTIKDETTMEPADLERNMNPIVILIFCVVCSTVAIVAGVNYIRHRREKKGQQQEQEKVK